MVQLFLGTRRQVQRAAIAMALAAPLLIPNSASPRSKPHVDAPERWQMSLDGGRTLSWEHSFNSESEVRPNRGFWNKLVDVIAGAPEFHSLVRPYGIAVDSHGRIVVTDPGAQGVHIFDFIQHKYKFIDRSGSKNAMRTPQCVALDDQDNIYVTDSDAGEIFVFGPSGKFMRVIGSLKGGEGYFKRPTGIAIDSAAQRIYVTDTLRDEVFILDMQGAILKTFGTSGEGQGEFNLPTELRLHGPDLMVVDAMNFRVQVFDRFGIFEYSIGKLGDSPGSFFRPKGIGVDSEGDLYVVDASWGVVQVFNRQGELLYSFGAKGTHAGEFQLPSGLSIDHDDRVYVVDSFNRRVQVFHYAALRPSAGEAIK